jgi:phosphate:Na+ symporter
MPAAAAAVDWTAIAFELLGGLALFLYGLDKLSLSLRAVAGDRLRTVLRKLTGNRWSGVATGAGVTAVIQSSSVTTVLVVGFISAEVLTLTQAIGVIFGANIGTTITAQIVAFKVTQVALPMIALGFGVAFLARGDILRQYGALVMGLGLVFFGMTLMGEAMQPLRGYPLFLDAMRSMASPLVGVLAGAVFTAVVQSSSATTAIVIVMATQGLISLEAGIALAFGANIGTCATALLAAVGKPREAVRAAMAHVLFNLAGVALWVAFIPELAWLVQHLTPQHPELVGTARLAAEVPREIANAHTLFNVANTVVFIGFVDVFARVVTWLVPDRPKVLSAAATPRHLKDEVLRSPSIGLDLVQRELGHLGALVDGMLGAIMPAALKGSAADLRAVAAMDADVDALHEAIVDYLRRMGGQELSASQMDRYVRLLAQTNALENIGDIIETDLVSIGLRRIEGAVEVSIPTQGLILDLHARAREAVALAVAAAVDGDVDKAHRVVAMKTSVAALAHHAAEHGAHRLTAHEPNRLRAVTREMEVIERLRRIYYFAKRIARAVLEQAGEPYRSPPGPGLADDGAAVGPAGAGDGAAGGGDPLRLSPRQGAPASG